MSDKHTFALYTNQNLPTRQVTAPGCQLTLVDADAWHQAANVLRLTPNEAVTLFDANTAVTITIQTLKKSLIAGVITNIEATRPLTPTIHLYQGLLKKESFEAVAYCAAQMGATTLTPVIGKKIHRMWYSAKDNERLTKIMISACQQAKQFVLPIIQEPVTVEELCKELTSRHDQIRSYGSTGSPRTGECDSSLYTQPVCANSVRPEPVEGCERIKTILFEPDGKPLIQALTAIHNAPTTTDYGIILGPEGGFTDEERHQLDQAGTDCYALTPTILRSIEAATVALGALRSVSR